MTSEIENYRLRLLRHFEHEQNEAEQAITENREKQERAKKAIARCMVEPPAPDYCPECWYLHGATSPMVQKNSDDGMIDNFMCPACGFLDRRPA